MEIGGGVMVRRKLKPQDEQRLMSAIEEASRQFLLTAGEIRQVAKNLPRRASGHALHLESLAFRLEGIAGQLGHEVMLVPLPGFVRLLTVAGRAVSHLALTSLVVVGTGFLEEAGSDQYRRSVEVAERSIASASELEGLLDVDDLASDSDWAAENDEVSHEVAARPRFFSGVRAAQLAGISYRQLDYWARSDLVRPSADVSQDGRYPYSYLDILLLSTVKTMLDAGVRLESVRTTFEKLREQPDHLMHSPCLIVSGSEIIFASRDELVDVLRNGQGVLNVVDLDSVRSELDERVGAE